MGRLTEDLLAGGRTLVETHISWVFLGDGEVFKVKKPVALGFLDFRSLEARRRFCEAEVELNRRLAPDAYLGVRPVTRGDDGVHRLGGEGAVVDFAVHMRRLPDEARADHLLARGALGLDEVARVAEHLAAFHARTRADAETARYGSLEVIEGNVRENFAQSREALAAYLSPTEADELEGAQLAFLARERDLFAERVRAGRVRDGHGDLRLEHVYLEGPERITVLDCIEFNERFRFADVGADLAFLAMDLVYAGRVDLAEHLLARYARAANDFDLYPLIDFYMGYRAFVRGKVSSFVASDPGLPSPVRERAAREARRHFQCALALERPPIASPVVIAIGGSIASGKSTLADALGARLGVPVVDSDRARKFLHGAEPTEGLAGAHFEGAYSAEATARVYAEVWRRAERVLASGRSVILDATFRSAAHRADARALARVHALPFVLLECRVDEATCRARLAARVRGAHVSDGRLELLDAFASRWEPVVELAPSEHAIVDTSRPLAANLEELAARLGSFEEKATGSPHAA